MLTTGTRVEIHAYKHNGKVHRSWEDSYVLEETDRHFIVMNNHTLVTESDGRKWVTKEPAIYYFPKDQWFNIICMIRNGGIYYYCNIASPTLYDGQAIKYIDYDLDLKVYPNFQYKVLDKEEYKYHKGLMHYSDALDQLLNKQLNLLIDMAENKRGPFKKEFVDHWYQVYLNNIKG